MATIECRGAHVSTAGEPPVPGDALPAFVLTLPDLTDLDSATFAGRPLVLNVFPSVDTGICAMSVRRFNELAAEIPDAAIVCISHDLPFALGRFCGAEGIDRVATASGFRSSFGSDYGLTMIDGPLRGLLARAVIVTDADHVVRHVELVDPVGKEPDYDAALAALV